MSVNIVMKNKRKELTEEINQLNQKVRGMNSYSKNSSHEMNRLIQLIIELDNLQEDKEENNNCED